jgi:hypothetical protein
MANNALQPTAPQSAKRVSTILHLSNQLASPNTGTIRQ